MSARSLVDKAAEFYSARRGFESYRARHSLPLPSPRQESGPTHRVDNAMNLSDITTNVVPDPSECALATEFGMSIAEQFAKKNCRALPLNDEEFAAMLGIAFMVGRMSVLRSEP